LARKKDEGRVVWSSDSSDSASTNETETTTPRTDGVVRVARQTKGRKGKGVTLITGVPLEGAQLKELAKTLKQRCGSGGTVKDGIIEIQGDHRDVLLVALAARGWAVKKSGG
jgi:translation initiation factor 1